MKRAASIIAAVLSVGCAVAGWRGRFDEQFAAAATARLPAEYQEVEYLQSTGTQYIDSGFVPTEQTKVEAKWIGTGNGRLYGYYSTTVGFTAIVGSNGGAAGWICKDQIVNINISWGTVYTSIHDATGVLTNGYVAATYEGVTAFTSAGTMHIFKHNNRNSSEFIGSIYYLKAWSGATMIRDYVPAVRKADGVAGMYDLVNGTFTVNSGTGTFAVGPDVQ